MKPIRVVIADDHELFRDGITALLSRADGIRVIGEASDGPSVLKVVDRTQPDIVLLDVEMPGPSVTTNIARLRHISPTTRLVILSMHRDRMLATQLLKAGASAYVTKTVATADLVNTIRITQLGNGPKTHTARRASSHGLSSRELEVLHFLALADSNAQIAARLSITVGTVKRHVYQLYRKLDTHSRVDAVRKARLLGLFPDH